MKSTSARQADMPTVKPLLPIQRILVGVDEDGRSDHAVRAALVLADKLDASLELIHAVNVPSSRWRNADPVRIAAFNAEALKHAWEALRHHFETAFAGEHPPSRLPTNRHYVPARSRGESRFR